MLCRPKFKIDQERKRVFEKRAPKGPWKHKKVKQDENENDQK